MTLPKFMALALMCLILMAVSTTVATHKSRALGAAIAVTGALGIALLFSTHV